MFMFHLSTRILIIDDMPTMRKLISLVCVELGFTNIAEAVDGVAGWEMISNEKPAIGLVLSDWDMPQCNGLDLLKRVRGSARFSKLPYVLLHTEAEKEKIPDAIKAGVSDCLKKPFTAALLKDRLEVLHKKVSK